MFRTIHWFSLPKEIKLGWLMWSVFKNTEVLRESESLASQVPYDHATVSVIVELRVGYSLQSQTKDNRSDSLLTYFFCWGNKESHTCVLVIFGEKFRSLIYFYSILLIFIITQYWQSNGPQQIWWESCIKVTKFNEQNNNKYIS